MRRFLLPFVVLLAVALPAAALPQPFPENPWPERRVLNISHRGGAAEFAENTLFAFHEALAAGTDVLEMDTYVTSDGEIVVIHDSTVDRTTNGEGAVKDLTLAEIKELDAAHWFVPGRHTTRNAEEDEYIFRGVATGDSPLPEGYEHYEPNDFTIPTLREVLETFPEVWLNIEIKTGPPTDASYAQQVADLLAEFDRTDDVIVVSFVDTVVEEFKVLAPEVSTATATGQTGVFWATAQGPAPGAPNPRYHALQVPIEFLGLTVVTEDFVERAQASDLAVHVWTINDPDTMRWLLDIGVDGIMTDRPSLLAEVLAERS